MSKSKKQVYFLIILLALFANYFTFPFIRVYLSQDYNPDQNYMNNVNLDSLYSSIESQNVKIDKEFENYDRNINSKFENKLKVYLSNLYESSIETPDFVKIIILFEDSVNKGKRIEIIDYLFDEYKLLSNYDIIPGIYIKVESAQLIFNEGLINGIKEIKQIYKSQIYKNPYIVNSDLQTSALNSGDYPNWWLSAIGADNLAYDGTGVKVAVIDTGVYNHPDLNIINNSNFVTDESVFDYNDDVGHGTHVAGIIGSNGGVSGEYQGVAPGAFIVNARAGNASGLLEGDIIKAIEWSSKPTSEGGAGADIISMSFGGGYPIISDIITQAITNAKINYGVLFVASSGNSGPSYFTGSTPASGIDVISVGATDQNDELASFSSWGPTFGYLGYPDLVAPGVDIISTEAQNSIISKEQRLINNYFDFNGNADYIPLSGTSMACPMVSGALAILLDAYPNITPETARIALLEGSKQLTNEKDNYYIKSGSGLINVTASLDYLNSISSDINNTAKISPNELPVEPYDLLNFPGDHQKFNLTVLSGKNNNYNIEIPSGIQGVTISADKSTIAFSEPGIQFLELDIKINKDAFPGVRDFQINLSVGGQVYDTIDILLNIKLPEYRILMESYHGLNDWFPNITGYNDVKLYQMGFYEAMADISEMNISIDYYMEYWTPNYNKDLNNSILTEERLAQYDIVLLQAPMLPYSPLEIQNIINYFENGGNLLFLGTRYQNLAVDNINSLFSGLNADIQINENNVMDDNWLGIGASVDSQSVINLDNNEIFSDVSKFYWLYGNSFTISGDAESIATLDGETVAAMYNGSSYGKGSIIAFGDSHWMYDSYYSSNFNQDHSNLLKNLMEFLLPNEEIAINIDLIGESTSKSTIDLYVYLKNQSTEAPIKSTDYTDLEVIVKNTTFSSSIILNTTYSDKGIYYNSTFNLPYPKPSPYTVEVNLTIGSIIFNKETKILYFDPNDIPVIVSLASDDELISRFTGASTNLEAELDNPTYDDIKGYLSIYSYSFYNMKKSVNKTLTFTHSTMNIYSYNFDPDVTDPSGYAIYYIIPVNSSYINPNSPRSVFEIINYAPEILKATSKFNFGGYSDIYFDETESNGGSYLFPATQGDIFNFEVDVRDGVSYEDQISDMRLFVNIFTCSVTEDGYIILIYPQTIKVAELTYEISLDKFTGSFTIPDSISYQTLSGVKSVSTASEFDIDTNQGYLNVLYLTLYDSEGGIDDFIIILQISPRPIDLSLIIIIVVSVIALTAIITIFVYYARRKKYPKTSRYQPKFEDYTYQPVYDQQEETYVTPQTPPSLGPTLYCPFCGGFISTPKKFCPHCGESVEFLGE